MKNRFIFFREWLKHWRQTGSVIPSSPALIKKMLARVDFESAQIIVELGAGTGPITRKILERMRPDCKLIVLELNQAFCEALRRIDDRRISIQQISATELSGVLAGNQADYIISGLPLTTLGKDTTIQILNEIKNGLKPEGAFIQFQYSLASLKMLKSIFSKVSISFAPINIPPAFVYYVS